MTVDNTEQLIGVAQKSYKGVQIVHSLILGPRPQWTGICEVNTESNDRILCE